MSQDGNLKSGHGETDWNIQSYLFDTRVSCVEIFQLGVLQETFSALISDIAAHISGQDWNYWRMVDLSHWNYVFTRSSSSPRTPIRSPFSLKCTIFESFPKFWRSKGLSAAYCRSHRWPWRLWSLSDFFFLLRLCGTSVFNWKERQGPDFSEARRGCSLKPAVPLCEACVSPWPWAFSEGLLPGETASGSPLPRCAAKSETLQPRATLHLLMQNSMGSASVDLAAAEGYPHLVATPQLTKQECTS